MHPGLCLFQSTCDYSVCAFPSACPPVGLCAAALVHLPVKSTYSMSWQTLSVKGQKESNFCFVGHTVSVTTIQPCHCGTKAAKDKVSAIECRYETIKLYLRKLGKGPDLACWAWFADS